MMQKSRWSRRLTALVLVGQVGLTAVELHAADSEDHHNVVQTQGEADHRHHRDECQICRTVTGAAHVSTVDYLLDPTPVVHRAGTSTVTDHSTASAALPPPARGPPGT